MSSSSKNDALIEIEETQEFAQICRQLRLTIEAAHGHGPDPAKVATNADAAPASVIE